MRKALVVGINYYASVSPLFGCANDAQRVNDVLGRNADGSPNFSVKFFAGTSPATAIEKKALKEHVRELFSGDPEIALFYFAGHGHIETTGGYLCGSDCSTGDDGLALAEVLTLANNSGARNRVIILDSCHSGVAGSAPLQKETAELKEGTTILTASTADQYANEQNGSGVFTSLLVDALEGAASNLVGDVTPGSVYAHIDQALGPWDQRPVFKTNVKSFVSLRTVKPPVGVAELRRIREFFPSPGYEFPLDPGYEPECESADPAKNAVFEILQKFNRVNLVVPVGAPHMWHAAMQSKGCKLTSLGEHYRRLAVSGRI